MKQSESDGGRTFVMTPLTHSMVDSVPAAVAAGLTAAKPGDILLFSPGYASFGMFKNEYERNDAFLDAVEKYVTVDDDVLEDRLTEQ